MISGNVLGSVLVLGLIASLTLVSCEQARSNEIDHVWCVDMISGENYIQACTKPSSFQTVKENCKCIPGYSPVILPPPSDNESTSPVAATPS